MKESQEVAILGSYYLEISTGKWISSSILDEIFGINSEYVRDTDNWVKIIHPDHQDEMLNYFSTEVLQKHKNFDKEYLIVTIDGKIEKMGSWTWKT